MKSIQASVIGVMLLIGVTVVSVRADKPSGVFRITEPIVGKETAGFAASKTDNPKHLFKVPPEWGEYMSAVDALITDECQAKQLSPINTPLILLSIDMNGTLQKLATV